MKYTRVKRAVSAVVIDGADSDANPDFVKVNGNVTFTPLLKAGDVVQYAGPKGPESLVLAPIECRISDGIIMHRGQEGVYLVAGGEGVQPDVIQWKATFSNMQAGGWAFTLKPVMFDAVPGGEVD
ncbi:TPA: collagen-like protein, partial [Corynebacterium striatum]|nr:collagen-like protein [Corynebacterium striatum]